MKARRDARETTGVDHPGEQDSRSVQKQLLVLASLGTLFWTTVFAALTTSPGHRWLERTLMSSCSIARDAAFCSSVVSEQRSRGGDEE